MEIRLFGGDGKPATEIPLKTGYVEITLPKKFFEGNPKSIALAWIDFYRCVLLLSNSVGKTGRDVTQH